MLTVAGLSTDQVVERQSGAPRDGSQFVGVGTSLARTGTARRLHAAVIVSRVRSRLIPRPSWLRRVALIGGYGLTRRHRDPAGLVSVAGR
jgi:hypothetical protein